MYQLLADSVLILHLAFILFVVAGGLLAFRWPRIAWLHIPAVAWGALVELMAWPCPLTPLENHLRTLAGDVPYEGDFVARYLLPIIYPEQLTAEIQMQIGIGVILLNGAVYILLMRRRMRR